MIPVDDGLTGFLARRALAFAHGDLPEDVRRRARHSLLDCLSVALAGRRHIDVGRLEDELLEQGGHPHCSIFGGTQRLSVYQAALLNGMAAHTLDFDDAHLPSRVHPSVPLWPAILACGERHSLSGADAIAAFVAGVEVQSRLAAAMGESHYRMGWHNTATLGAFGATAAVGRLRKLDAERLNGAFGLAASDAAGLRAAFSTACKPLHAGLAASKGLFAANMAARGFAGPRNTFDQPDGYLALHADHHRREDACLRPDHWFVRDIVFKHHASCYGTQAPIEAARALAVGVAATDIDKVIVEVEPQYLSVCGIATPRTASEARFSVAHMVALALLGRDTVGEGGFAPAMLGAADMATLRDQVVLVANDELPRATSRVTLSCRDGRSTTHRADAGQPEQDLGAQEQRLLRKSSALLADLYRDEAIATIQELILGLEYESDLALWASELSRALLAARHE